MDDHGERLARIETKVDLLLAREDKADKRLSAVEKKLWIHTGGVGVLAFVLSKFGIPGLPH